MRFLLHAKAAVKRANPSRTTKEVISRVGSTATSVSQSSPPRVVVSQSQRSDIPLDRAWGQQCSPNCGCVLRFETSIHPQTDKVINSTFSAKTVITNVSSSQKLTPVYTTSKTPRPIIKECQCHTLLTLSRCLSDFCHGRTISQLQNMTEFESVRSSAAFRHAVLRRLDLDVKHTRCFDLVEEAFVAMVKGYMPKPRRVVSQSKKKKNKKIIMTKPYIGTDVSDFIPLPSGAFNLHDMVIDGGSENWKVKEDMRSGWMAHHWIVASDVKKEEDEYNDWVNFVDEQEKVYEQELGEGWVA